MSGRRYFRRCFFPMQMPMPAGTPVPLPADVAGSLSRMQGLLQANQPEIQNAYALHWLATREAGGIPQFQQMTQQMLWGLYGTVALQGLLRFALSGRGTPEVLSGIIDQANLIRQSYTQAADSLRQFLELPEAQQFPSVPMMVRGLAPLDRVYQAFQQPIETVLTGVPFTPGPTINMIPLQQSLVTWPPAPPIPETEIG